jgi:hypothetical protein
MKPNFLFAISFTTALLTLSWGLTAQAAVWALFASTLLVLACIDWDTTEALLREAAQMLRSI